MSMNSYLSDNGNFNANHSNGKSENFICDFKNVCLKENVHLKRDKKTNKPTQTKNQIPHKNSFIFHTSYRAKNGV